MIKLITKPFCTIFLALFAFASFGQDFSNKGKDFWLAFPAHVDGTGAVMGIYITSDKAATGQVQVGASTIPFSITANGLRRIFVGPNGDVPNTSVYLSQLEGIAVGAGIRVTSDQPVVVYAHIIRSARSGATLTLPTTVWGKDYIVPSYQSAGASGANSGFGTIAIMAKEAGTVVEIIPKQTSRTGQPAGTPYTITLSQPGDVYQVQYTKDADISGTVVRSIATNGVACKPIAVFSGSTWSAFDCIGASGGDNLFQQLFPSRSWGKNFITAPFINKLYDIYRVFVSDASAVVRRTENGVTTQLTGLQAGGFYEFKTNFPNSISSDKPISVVQYMTSESCDNNGADRSSDPEMVILNPLEQTINNITVFSAHQLFVPPGQSNVNQCFLNIIIKSNATGSFRINGSAPTSGWITIPGTGFSYLQENVSVLSQSNPVQTLTADSSFSAIAYGYGNVESYGYNAGTAVKDLFQFITIKNELATVNFPATCVNSPFNFAITLPYQATKLEWKFYGRFNDTIVNSPTPDSTLIVEGRTLYQYKLPRTYLLTTKGTYKVTVVATNPSPDGCSGEQVIDYELEVFDKPGTDFSWTHTGCVTDSVRFSDLSNGFGRPVNRWLWTFGNGTTDSVKNPVRLYNTPGTYTITQKVVTDIGCIADASKTITVTLPPTASFSSSAPACAGQAVTFTDGSTPPAGATLSRWIWDFGNGRRDTLSTNAARTIVYNTPGTYTVTLLVETSGGCRSTIFSRAIVVNATPVASFTLPAGVCLPSGRAAFTNTSSIAGGTALSFNWNFGDNQTSTTVSPIHFYSGTGPFTVRLTATSAAGCIKDSVQVLSNVFAQPKSVFTVQAELCLRDTTRLQSQSTAVGQTLVKHYWSLGDNTLDSGLQAKKRYNLPGSYTIRHWAISDKGCSSDTTSQVHIVNALPVADFGTNTPTCVSTPILFTDKSVGNSGAITRWQWDLGDGTRPDLSNGNPFTHSYTAFGSKTVLLRVTNNKGCVSDTLRKTVAVGALPEAAFVLPEVCLTDASAQFVNNTTINDGTGAQLTWQWNFGDANANAGNPNTSTAKNGQHRYSAVGDYIIQLIATSAAGCSDTLRQTLTVNGDNPKADFTVLQASSLCANIPVAIQNISTVNFGKVTKTEIFWEWPNAAIKTVDDDPVSNEVYNHSYTNFNSPATKTVQVRMLAYSGGVCVNEVIKSITLNASPRVVFSTIPGICLDATPRLITQGRDVAGLTGSGVYRGTGVAASGLFTPSVAGAGTFTLQYKYTSAAGCSDSASQTITVWPRPIANFSTVGPTCVSNASTFSDASTTAANKLATWNWTFGDGNGVTRTSAAPFGHTYAATGNYTATLQVITDSGCTSVPVSKPVTVHPLPVVNFTLPTVCMPLGTANFTDASTIADGTGASMTYLWRFGVPGATSTQRNPVYNYPGVGNYTVQLVVTSNNGCKDSASKVLSDVNPQPLANFDMTPSSVCLGAPIVLADRSNPLSQTIVTRSWDFGNGQKGTDANATITYAQAGSYTVSYFYTTNKGCNSDTVTKVASVNPFPVVSAGPDLVVLEGGETTIRATASGSSNYRYAWTPAQWLSAANVLQPVVKPQGDITYRLTVTGAGGCSASDDVFVKLLLAPEIPNAFSPNGDGINEVWNIKYLDSYPGAVVQVFDRHGKRIYYSKGYLSPWDGKVSGAVVPVGVYYYVIEPGNGRKPYQGSVTIIR